MNAGNYNTPADGNFINGGTSSQVVTRAANGSSANVSANVAIQIELAWQQRELSPDRSRQILDDLPPPAPLMPLATARIEVLRCFHLGRVFELKAAVDCGVAVLPLLLEKNDRLWLARLYGRIAVCLHSLGDMDTAMHHYNKQIDLANELLGSDDCTPGDRQIYSEELFLGLHNIGYQHFRTGNFNQAMSYYSECDSLVDDNNFLSGFLLVNSSSCNLALHNHDTARQQALRAMAIGERLGIRRVLVYVLPVLAQLATVQSDTTGAEEFFTQSD